MKFNLDQNMIREQSRYMVFNAEVPLESEVAAIPSSCWT